MFTNVPDPGLKLTRLIPRHSAYIRLADVHADEVRLWHSFQQLIPSTIGYLEPLAEVNTPDSLLTQHVD